MIAFLFVEIKEKKTCVKKQKADTDSAPAASVSQSPVVPPTTEKKSQSGDKTMSLEKSIRATYREGQPFSFFLTRVKGISSQYNSSFVMGISGKFFFLYLIHIFSSY